mmetsp:Transcript_30987/g.64961  ORF Transcript_30987/g.64961 Transcript_30987/m.64961 type:complete len:294 (+) Transcript_30987:307-1188(+)
MQFEPAAYFATSANPHHTTIASQTRGEPSLGSDDRLDDVGEFRLERGAPHQKAVDVRHRGEVGRVLRVGGPTVLNADLIGSLLVDIGGDPLTQSLVRLLRLLRRGGHPSADGPHGLVGDDHARLVLERLEDRDDVLQLVDALGDGRLQPLLADGERLADAEDAHQPLLEDVRQLGRHQLVALLRCGQAELAAALRVSDQAALEAEVDHLVHRHLARVRPAPREVAVLRRDHNARLELVVHQADVQVGRADVHVALVQRGSARREVGDELRELRLLRGVALPVASDNRLASHGY